MTAAAAAATRRPLAVVLLRRLKKSANPVRSRTSDPCRIRVRRFFQSCGRRFFPTGAQPPRSRPCARDVLLQRRACGRHDARKSNRSAMRGANRERQRRRCGGNGPPRRDRHPGRSRRPQCEESAAPVCATPAPIQVTWLGYPNTTGMSAMDFRLTDAFADPPGTTETLHAERLIRLRSNWCYPPPVPAVAGEVVPPPASTRGGRRRHVRFFQQPGEAHGAVVAVVVADS